jgi:hypothetical protein
MNATLRVSTVPLKQRSTLTCELKVTTSVKEFA